MNETNKEEKSVLPDKDRVKKPENIEQSRELDELKKKILDKTEKKKEKRGLQWSSIFITIILILLVSAASVQAYQSKIVLDKIQSGKFKSSGSAGAALPSSIENLPNMVGGC